MAGSKRKTGKAAKSRGPARLAAGKGGGARGAKGSAGARKMRLERIRKEIRNGTYETEGKLRIAISRLIDDALTRCAKDRR